MNSHQLQLLAGIRFRFVDNANGLNMHILKADFTETNDRPCILLLHGFPELPYSRRKIILPLAQAGFNVIAPDQRGYGQTTGGTQITMVIYSRSVLPTSTQIF